MRTHGPSSQHPKPPTQPESKRATSRFGKCPAALGEQEKRYPIVRIHELPNIGKLPLFTRAATRPSGSRSHRSWQVRLIARRHHIPDATASVYAAECGIPLEARHG